jgi:hypothetical protein
MWSLAIKTAHRSGNWVISISERKLTENLFL